MLGRDFASQHTEQLRISREVAIESYQYQLLRTAVHNIDTDENTIDLDEALDGLACLSMTPTLIATLKAQRGRFFENLDGSLYKSVFNPTVSGIKVVNAVIHLRVIEKLIESKLMIVDRNANRKRHLIITHANRVLTALLINKESRILNATEIVTPNERHLSSKLDFLCQETEGYIEDNYTNAYPARFFSNVEKVTEILKILTEKLQN